MLLENFGEGGAPSKFGAQKRQTLDHFSRDFHTWHRIVDLLFVDFDPETAEIRWGIVTHPMKI